MKLKEIKSVIAFQNVRPSQFNEYYKERIKEEEDVLVKVLLYHLNRPVTNDDAKKCSRVFVGNERNRYTFTYEGVALGEVFISPFTSVGYTIEFKPLI